MRTRTSSLIERGVVYSIIVILFLCNIAFLLLLIRKRNQIARKEKDFKVRADQMVEEKRKELDTVKGFLPEWEVRLAQQQRGDQQRDQHQDQRCRSAHDSLRPLLETPHGKQIRIHRLVVFDVMKS